MYRVYCTYFDKNYLARGLALLESLRAQGGPFSLYVLCLDEVVYDRLSGLGAEDVVPVPLKTLEAADLELNKIRSTRSLIEYYFTCTPAFVRYVLSICPECSDITYLDSDLYFFSDPELVFEEIGSASIAIVAHRFTQRTYLNRSYGIFNVGWITWKCDMEGLRCLEDYRRSCLEWCYDYWEGRRFADQRYLDTWPVDYQGVCVISHPGANLAPWNLDTGDIALRDGKVVVRGFPLVFFHFHGLKRRTDGGYDRRTGAYVSDAAMLPEPEVLDAIYAPYEAALERLAQGATDVSVRIAPPHPSASLPAWQYRPEGWLDSLEEPGWEGPAVCDALKSRFLVVRRRLGTSEPMGNDLGMHNQAMLLGYVFARARQEKRPLRILDWNGGIGLSYMTLKSLLPEQSFDYHCFTSEKLADSGRSLNPDVVFHADAKTALAMQYDLVMANGTLQHEKNWEDVLSDLADCAMRWLLITRLSVVSSVPSFVAVQRLYRSDYQTAFQLWSINIRSFEAVMRKTGLHLDRQFFASERPYIPDAPEHPEVCGFLFGREIC